jgi:hypothetical protein
MNKPVLLCRYTALTRYCQLQPLPATAGSGGQHDDGFHFIQLRYGYWPCSTTLN